MIWKSINLNVIYIVKSWKITLCVWKMFENVIYFKSNWNTLLIFTILVTTTVWADRSQGRLCHLIKYVHSTLIHLTGSIQSLYPSTLQESSSLVFLLGDQPANYTNPDSIKRCFNILTWFHTKIPTIINNEIYKNFIYWEFI